jgi:hypothetical protein
VARVDEIATAERARAIGLRPLDDTTGEQHVIGGLREAIAERLQRALLDVEQRVDTSISSPTSRLGAFS